MMQCPNCGVNLLSPAEVGAMLNLSESRIRAVLADGHGRIDAGRVGREWVVLASSARSFQAGPPCAHLGAPPANQATPIAGCPACGKRFLSVSEVASLLGLTASGVYALLSKHLEWRGVLRFGRRWFLSERWVDAYRSWKESQSQSRATEPSQSEGGQAPDAAVAPPASEKSPAAAQDIVVVEWNDDRAWISTDHAAALSGYTSNYVACLARSGTIAAKKRVRDWWVNRESLMAYKANMDRRRGKRGQRHKASTSGTPDR